MKDDQIVRIVVAVCLVAGYFIHVAVNGGDQISLFVVGEVEPFSFLCLIELTLAFPELLDRLPFGPTRKNE